MWKSLAGIPRVESLSEGSFTPYLCSPFTVHPHCQEALSLFVNEFPPAAIWSLLLVCPGGEEPGLSSNLSFLLRPGWNTVARCPGFSFPIACVLALNNFVEEALSFQLLRMATVNVKAFFYKLLITTLVQDGSAPVGDRTQVRDDTRTWGGAGGLAPPRAGYWQGLRQEPMRPCLRRCVRWARTRPRGPVSGSVGTCPSRCSRTVLLQESHQATSDLEFCPPPHIEWFTASPPISSLKYPNVVVVGFCLPP